MSLLIVNLYIWNVDFFPGGNHISSSFTYLSVVVLSSVVEALFSQFSGPFSKELFHV